MLFHYRGLHEKGIAIYNDTDVNFNFENFLFDEQKCILEQGRKD
jgi:hypothetical protein